MTALARRLPFLTRWLRRRRADPSAPADRSCPAAAARGAASAPAPLGSSALDEARAAAMRRLFPKLFAWHATRAQWRVAHDAYACLAAADSLDDLERRIRAVERRRRDVSN